MTIETKIEIKEDKVSIPKGTRGLVKAFQWGDKKDGYVVDFIELSGVYVAKTDATVLTERVVAEKKPTKTHSTYEENSQKKIKGDKSTREEELQP